jgi:UMF1 family MFS transporter
LASEHAAREAAPPQAGLLARLGLDRPDVRAWVLYDWANSAFVTTVMTAVYPVYFVAVASAGTSRTEATARLGWATAFGMFLVAVLSPILGTVADFAGAKKRMLAVSLVFGVATTAALAFVGAGEWRLGLLLFVLANIGVTMSFVFYESLLPHIASEEEIDRVSAAGYALGYLGGGLLLALNLWWIQRPETFGFRDAEQATRMSFLSAAIWWAVFSIPIFRNVPEPPAVGPEGGGPRPSVLRASFGQLGQTLRELRSYKQAFLLLLAFLLYNDGIQTIIRMSGAYGAELGISPASLITSYLVVQFVGVPFAFLFGNLAPRIGVKRCLFIPIAVYLVVTFLSYRMRTGRDFMILAVLVGTVMGGSQAISRSLFATMIPRQRSGEFFGFWSVFEKFAGVFGPLVFAAVIGATGQSRPAILSLIVFFVLGGLLLAFVDVEEGRAHARRAEAELGAGG